jgi:hypothetical protein
MPGDQHLAGFEISFRPSKTEYLSSPKPENKHQYVRRVERVIRGPCRFEESPGLLHSPSPSSVSPWNRHLDQSSDITRDELVPYGGGQRALQHRPCLVPGPFRGDLHGQVMYTLYVAAAPTGGGAHQPAHSAAIEHAIGNAEHVAGVELLLHRFDDLDVGL